jgi:hypothetical protein
VQRVFVGLLLALAACGGSSPQTVQLREAIAAAGSTGGSAVAFRVPTRRGATVRVYELPTLEAVRWRLDATAFVTDRIVGLAGDDDLLHVLSAGTLWVLDLRSGRFRTLDSAVTHADLSPTGTLLAAHRDGTLSLAADRRLSPAGRVSGRLEALWPAPGGRGAAVVRGDSGRMILLLNGGDVAERRVIPDGPIAKTLWGDAAAVAGPEGPVVLELLRETAPRPLAVRDEVLALTFSGSGHRVYVATAAPEILVFDRFEGDRLGRIALPDRVTALRADPFGRYLFGRAGTGFALVVLADGAVRAVAGEWDDDLPTATADGSLLLRRGADVVALAPDASQERGRVAGGAADRWLVAPWDVRRPGPQVAQQAATPRTATGGDVPGQQLFVQVSSTSNAQWAEGLASDLRIAGMRATVLAPTTADEMYRVVLGPYTTREEAETIGRKLGLPFWIFTRETTTAQ